ncbi:hypothetical protein [Nocardia sp.]|uniref:hypothetical protein n=1 Tax=Nocardia sp. TaxID=1821 RepID=UPI002604701A|nr:hypothetical protein [Nocardia sp.]
MAQQRLKMSVLMDRVAGPLRLILLEREPQMQIPPLDPAREALAIADELNEIAVPLGYSVLIDTHMPPPPAPASTHFIVRQLGGTTVHATSAPDSVRRYLAELADKPRWRLNLDDESIEVSGAVITDKQTGEQIDLSGRWAQLIGNVSSVDDYRRDKNVHHLSVVGDQAPAIGAWHRWPAHAARD